MKLVKDNARLKEAAARVTEWLQHVWQLMEDGRIDTLQPRPHYVRRNLLTEATVDEVVDFLENTVFQYEIDHYPGYHYEQQGLNPEKHQLISPQFSKLTKAQKRALVERYDEIMQDYRHPSDKPPVLTPTSSARH